MYSSEKPLHSIVHRGPGPHFFAPSVVDYLFGGLSAVKPCIEDVPDDAIREKIRKVMPNAWFNTDTFKLIY